MLYQAKFEATHIPANISDHSQSDIQSRDCGDQGRDSHRQCGTDYKTQEHKVSVFQTAVGSYTRTYHWTLVFVRAHRHVRTLPKDLHFGGW